MTHHTKDKGDLGVAKAIADLVSKEFTILLPLTEHAPFDLVAYKNDVFYRIQVRYRKLHDQGTLHIELVNNWSDKHGRHQNKFDSSKIDYFCIYCPDTDSCYYIKSGEKNNEATISLRIMPSKNNQEKCVNFAKDFTTLP